MLTKYELSCGKVERKLIKGQTIDLYLEHNTYHVKRISPYIDNFRYVVESWLCFDNLKDAKKAFKRQCEIAKSF